MPPPSPPPPPTVCKFIDVPPTPLSPPGLHPPRGAGQAVVAGLPPQGPQDGAGRVPLQPTQGPPLRPRGRLAETQGPPEPQPAPAAPRQVNRGPGGPGGWQIQSPKRYTNTA